MEPVSAAIMGGGQLLSGLVSSYFTYQAQEQALEANRRAQDMNYEIAQQNRADEDKRFSLQNALENMKFKLYKEGQEWSQQEQEDAKKTNMAFSVANNIANMGREGASRGQDLANSWAQQVRR